MAVIHMEREHDIEVSELKSHIGELIARFEESFHADYAWHDDTLTFQRKGASGRIAIDRERIEIDIKLGLVMRPFRGKIEQALNDYLDEYLG